MAIHVKVLKTGGGDPLEVRGENVSLDGHVMHVWTEPHEIRPGGLVDGFVGHVVVLAPGDEATVVRV